MLVYPRRRAIRRSVLVILETAVGRARVSCAALTVTKQEGHDSLDLDAAAVHAGAGGPQRVPVAAMEQALDDGLHAHGPPGAIRFLRLRL